MRARPETQALRLVLAASLAIVACLGPTEAAPASAGRLAFDVTRNGQPFGSHQVEVTGAAGRFEVESRAVLRANVGPVAVFRYEHSCSERWEEGRLARLDCSTLRDGRRTRVSVARDGDQLRAAGAGEETFFPAQALPTSWWSKPPTNLSYMIDAETGRRMPVSVTRIGRETMNVSGAPVAVEHLRVRGSLVVDLWYDLSGRWVGCAFTARGQRIEYRLVTPLTAAPA